jgi:hypothetical protein
VPDDGQLLAPDQIQAAYDRAVQVAVAAYDRDFGPAVRRELLADLATWPAAFQRRIGRGRLLDPDEGLTHGRPSISGTAFRKAAGSVLTMMHRSRVVAVGAADSTASS